MAARSKRHGAIELRTITVRFAMWLATAAIVPLLLYGGVSISRLQVGTQQSVISGNLAVAARAAEQIELYVNNNLRVLDTLANNLENMKFDEWQRDRTLKNTVLKFPEFREITLFDALGKPVASSRIGPPGIVVPPAASTQPHRVTMSQVVFDDESMPTAVITVRMTHGSEPIGWLAGEIRLEELWRMVDSIRIGDHGFALVVASGGQLVAHGDPNQKALVAQKEDFSGHPLVQAARRDGPIESLATEIERGGTTLVAAAAPTTSPALKGWTVIVEQPRSEAYAISTTLARQLTIAIVLALLVTVVVGLYWGRQFIRPIFTLIRGTQAVAQGRLDERVHIPGQDEFHQLGEAFNSMADSIVQLQEDVRKKERHAVFGRIVAGLVHDLSTPVQNVGNSCKLMMRAWDDLEYREIFKRTVTREVETLQRVLEDLRNVAKPMPIATRPMDLNRSVVDIVESMRSQADGAGVALDALVSFDAVFIEGDQFALGRVYRNLLANAIQATPPGGRVSIGTARQGSFAEVRISDTGCGIEPERLNSIFEDFVTTKRRGLGLGLSITKRIVEQMHGTISVTSEVGRGTTFVLQFPATQAVAAAV
jgi:signal transduction histidine kinase